MTGTTCATTIAAVREDLRRLAAAHSAFIAPAEPLGAVLLGGWPAVPDGPGAAMQALQELVQERDDAGVGLMAGLLAAEPAPLTQLAHLSGLTSLTRALAGRAGSPEFAVWQRDLDAVAPAEDEATGDRLTALREALDGWTADLVTGRWPETADVAVLAGLASLEARASLARAAQVNRRLAARENVPRTWRILLERWIAAAHDLRRLGERLSRGEQDEPRAVRSRLESAFGAKALLALAASAASCAGGQRLERLFKRLAEPALRVEDPSGAFERMLALIRAQGDRTLLAPDPDPVLLGIVILEQGRGSWLKLDVPGERLATALRLGFEPPPGVAVVGDALHVACTPSGAALPPAPPRPRAVEENDQEQVGQAALKQLVLSNIGTTSVLLEFLRDAKVTSIPGLVEEIVNRTRNPQVLETVASVRALNSGFANRNVPLALLRSPVNVSVRTLRRFIHVKYVSKLELKRMAADKSGLRKEVHREIEKYLSTLV